ncbi:MAG: DUF1232 domain-containing protein [Deltaproteobacteria bacterium]|nr:DUF1232 domain-containing protein [Deltaproteobacteria bacterium]MBW2393631.1 DUF1232 domain-containing protein [Deltaproteobacteria bacterium]
MPASEREERVPAIEIELGGREKRFYDRIRGQLQAPVHGASTGLKDILLLLPDLTVLMFRLLRDDRVAIGDKAIALLGIGYVLSPIDLMPEFLFGPFGLIDDVLVISATLSRLVNHVHPDIVRSHWAGQGDALDAIQRLTGWAEDQFSGRLGKAVRRLFG